MICYLLWGDTLPCKITVLLDLHALGWVLASLCRTPRLGSSGIAAELSRGGSSRSLLTAHSRSLPHTTQQHLFDYRCGYIQGRCDLCRRHGKLLAHPEDGFFRDALALFLYTLALFFNHF